MLQETIGALITELKNLLFLTASMYPYEIHLLNHAELKTKTTELYFRSCESAAGQQQTRIHLCYGGFSFYTSGPLRLRNSVRALFFEGASSRLVSPWETLFVDCRAFRILMVWRCRNRSDFLFLRSFHSARTGTHFRAFLRLVLSLDRLGSCVCRLRDSPIGAPAFPAYRQPMIAAESVLAANRKNFRSFRQTMDAVVNPLTSRGISPRLSPRGDNFH